MVAHRHPKWREIVKLLKAGGTDVGISRQLGVPASTVHKYRERYGPPTKVVAPFLSRYLWSTRQNVGTLRPRLEVLDDAFLVWLLHQMHANETIADTMIRLLRKRHEEETRPATPAKTHSSRTG